MPRYKRALQVTPIAVVLLISTVTSALAEAVQQQPATDSASRGLDQLLTFISTIAQWVGQGITDLIHLVLPTMSVPAELIDPLGYLSVLTVVLIMAEVSRRLGWAVAILGWIMILIRIVMANFS